jgi:hypothetical protein
MDSVQRLVILNKMVTTEMYVVIFILCSSIWNLVFCLPCMNWEHAHTYIQYLLLLMYFETHKHVFDSEFFHCNFCVHECVHYTYHLGSAVDECVHFTYHLGSAVDECVHYTYHLGSAVHDIVLAIFFCTVQLSHYFPIQQNRDYVRNLE